MTSTTTTPVIFDCARQSNTGQYIHVRTAKITGIAQCQPIRLKAFLSGREVFNEMVEVKDNQVLFSDIPFFSNFPYAKNSYWFFFVFTNDENVSFSLVSNNAVELPDDYLQNPVKPISETGLFIDVEVGNLIVTGSWDLETPHII